MAFWPPTGGEGSSSKFYKIWRLSLPRNDIKWVTSADWTFLVPEILLSSCWQWWRKKNHSNFSHHWWIQFFKKWKTGSLLFWEQFCGSFLHFKLGLPVCHGRSPTSDRTQHLKAIWENRFTAPVYVLVCAFLHKIFPSAAIRKNIQYVYFPSMCYPTLDTLIWLQLHKHAMLVLFVPQLLGNLYVDGCAGKGSLVISYTHKRAKTVHLFPPK